MTSQSFDAARDKVASMVSEHWKLFLVEGILLVVLGLLAVAVPVIAGLTVAIVFGWLFLISGIVGLFTTFAMRHAPGFWWSLLSAVLGIVAGGWLLAQPGVSAPIVGASKLHHLDDSVKALGTHLTAEESQKLEGPYETQPPLPLYIRPSPTAAEAAARK